MNTVGRVLYVSVIGVMPTACVDRDDAVAVDCAEARSATGWVT